MAKNAYYEGGSESEPEIWKAMLVICSLGVPGDRFLLTCDGLRWTISQFSSFYVMSTKVLPDFIDFLDISGFEGSVTLLSNENASVISVTSDEGFSVSWNAQGTIGHINGEVTGNSAEGFLGHMTITFPRRGFYFVSHSCQTLEVDDTTRKRLKIVQV